MSRLAIAIVVLFAAVLVQPLLTGDAAAQETKPIQLALFNPLQIYSEDLSIKGFRFNLIYGKNLDLTGVDLGIANVLEGDMKGIQLGIIALNEGGMKGWQAGFVNIADGDAVGFQWSQLYNGAGSIHGVQLGLVNNTKMLKGLQLGILNLADAADGGLQIGLVNVIKSKEKLKFFPIVNWSF
ncbi:MAG: hypothetical protein JSW50_15025 [Candidatus Latescibacterota bacterium]|nr:MAG: hypothetical protein JSW50_15025 [Candidatus Latescibacterota bacterium]